MVQSDALDRDGFTEMLGMSLADLLMPIAGHPAGSSLKGSAIYGVCFCRPCRFEPYAFIASAT